MNLEHEIQQLKERNRRVELDKAWETSVFRKVVIALLTYACVVSLFVIADVPAPWLNAAVPTVTFILSTLSLPLFKRLWSRFIHKD